MATRAFILPKAILGNIQYLNPVIEAISTDKEITPLDSSIQVLNPGNMTLKVILPEEIYCDGMIFDIVNSSTQNGVLQIYDYTQTNKLFDLRPGIRKQFICLTNSWKSYSTFDPSYQDFQNEIIDYIFQPTQTSDEINSIITSIPSYIHPNKTINFKFESGDYNNTNLFIEHFYGGGVINIKCSDITCKPQIKGNSGNGFEIRYNKNIIINMDGIVIDQSDDNINYQKNFNTVLNINNCRITNNTGSPSGNGIYCTFDIIEQEYYHSNINIRNTQFGNLNTCVYLNGDYFTNIRNCSIALTESSSPAPMPCNHLYHIIGGATVVYDSISDSNIGNGLNSSGMAYGV